MHGCYFGPTGPSPHGHTIHVWTSQPSAEAAAGRREARTSESPHWAGGWGSVIRLRKVWGLCPAAGVPSASLSQWCQNRTALLSPSRLPSVWEAGGVGGPKTRSSRGGEREADSLQNSQRPAKAYWGPDLVHVLRRCARLWKGQWEHENSSSYTQKLCCGEGAHKRNPRKLKTSKWRKEKKNLAELNGLLKGKEF